MTVPVVRRDVTVEPLADNEALTGMRPYEPNRRRIHQLEGLMPVIRHPGHPVGLIYERNER
jgi:hypothetical protein